jgi:hypothetical protein
MSERATRPSGTDSSDAMPASAPAPAKRVGQGMGSSGLSQRIAAPRSLEEAEAHYVGCRDAWTAAMRAASSGRPADLATLAICQEAYEAASAERDRWLSGQRTAVPVEPVIDRAPIDVVVEQTLAWRDVHDHEKPRGMLGRLFGRRPKD